MKHKLSLKNEDRGASLLAVLMVMAVVSLIAVVITKVTLTNIQMKEVERGTKKNFYSAEGIMDELYAGACELSADAMKAAYVDVMENYLNYTKSGKQLQKVFSRNYIKNLEDTFHNATVAQTQKLDASGDVSYSISQYKTDVVKGCIAAAADQNCFKTEEADAPTYDADYEEGTLTLHKVKVSYTDAQGYETTINTDLVFSTPNLSFSGDSSKEFMKYSLIADEMINVNFPNITVGGNVYAGPDGIIAQSHASGNFNGKVILTRGDIVTKEISALTVGNSGSNVWAENIATEGSSTSSMLLNGNCYVADDLSLNGRGSQVSVTGNYYGYNFQKNYDTQQVSLDSDFSSAMMVNAKDCKLDLQNIGYLMLAGKTFISRNSSGGNDVMLGESLAVRTNQLAYNVPGEYVSGNMFTSDGLYRFSQKVGISDIANYLNPYQQVVAYHYRDNGIDYTYYYLNFKDEQAANDYFAVYCNTTKSDTVNGYASNYLSDDAIILDNNRIFTLRGDIMYRTGSGLELKEEKVTIDPADWSTTGVFWDFASGLAVKYKSLQLSLAETYAGVKTDNVRLTDDGTATGTIDKSVNPMFDHLIDRAAFVAEVNTKGTDDGNGNKVYMPVDAMAADNIHHQSVILVDNAGSNTYDVTPLYSEGIIVATGDVCVQQNFKGLIISGGTISFLTGANVDSNKMLVTKLFTDDAALDDPLFSKFFYDFNGTSKVEKALDTVDLNAFLNYQNWKKN